MDIETIIASSGRSAIATATGVSIWGMTVGDFGVGTIGVATLVVTAGLNLYSKVREEQRAQRAKDLEISKDSWKAKYDQAHEAYDAATHLLETQREEIAILRRRVQELSKGAHHDTGES